MNLKSLKIGEYQILNVFQQLIDGTMVNCAEAYYKQETTATFKNNIIIIRTGALYNPTSIGPKHIKEEELIYGILVIKDLKLIPDTNHPQNPKRCVIWEIINANAFDNLKDIHGEFEMDFLIQHQEEQAELQNIIDGNLYEDLESQNHLEGTRVGDQSQTEREVQDQAF